MRGKGELRATHLLEGRVLVGQRAVLTAQGLARLLQASVRAPQRRTPPLHLGVRRRQRLVLQGEEG